MTSEGVSGREIGAKVFTEADQHLFARLSHDRNPIHTDAVEARRLMTGRLVVHGVHILLAALECWDRESAPPVFISAHFDNPVSVGDPLTFTTHEDGDSGSIVEACVDGLVCARIVLSSRTDQPPSRLATAAERAGDSRDTIPLTPIARPMEEPPDTHVGKRYVVPLDGSDLSRAFPVSHRVLGGERLSAIAALSYFVGMVCPGRHSVLSSFDVDLRAAGQAAGELRFSVDKYDSRFQLFIIGVHGALAGNVRAFLRPPPHSQPSILELSGRVTANEFRATRSLIIGGSRGLGEVTAKLIAAGGGNVVITYVVGLDDAERVRADITTHAQSRCEVKRFDVLADGFEALDLDWNTLDAIYYFPTPKIFRKKPGVFDGGVFREFYRVYVEKFYELCKFLELRTVDRVIRVYCPSTIAVNERPRGMTEYAMAKSAVEILSQEINRDFEKVRVICTRLPRLSTDQTVSILKVKAESTEDTMLAIINAVMSR